MGVMACGRRHCEHVMCRQLVRTGDDEHYICDDCLAELRRIVTALPRGTDDDAVLVLVQEFMDSSSGDTLGTPRLDDEYFDRVVLATPQDW